MMRGYVTKERGRWRARLVFDDGSTKSKSFDAEADARLWTDRQTVDWRTGDFIDPRRGEVLFGDYATKWWDEHRHTLRPTTQSAYRDSLRIHLLPRWGAVPIGKIRRTDVKAWVADMATAGTMKSSSVHRHYRLLRRILAEATADEQIARNPATDITNLPSDDSREMRFLTPAEIATLAAAIEPRYRALVLVAAYGGLRISELAGLRRCNVDLKAGVVHVREVSVEVRGHMFIGEPKTAAGVRDVPLPAPVTKELKRHIMTYALPHDDGLVFPGANGGVLRSGSFRARFWRPAIKAAGLEGLRVHDLRHTAVTLWLGACRGNYKEVARRAGHTNVAFTMQRYGHVTVDMTQEVTDRLGDVYVAPKAGEVRQHKGKDFGLSA